MVIALMGVVLDAGGEDMKRQGDFFEIVTDPASFNKVQEALSEAKMLVNSSELSQVPKTYVDVPDVETAMRVVKLVDALDDHDDVQNVYTNLNMTAELAAQMERE